MIPAQRQPEAAETVQPSPADAPIFHEHTITQPGCNQAGDMFRTHRATVTAQPKGDGR